MKVRTNMKKLIIKKVLITAASLYLTQTLQAGTCQNAINFTATAKYWADAIKQDFGEDYTGVVASLHGEVNTAANNAYAAANESICLNVYNKAYYSAVTYTNRYSTLKTYYTGCTDSRASNYVSWKKYNDNSCTYASTATSSIVSTASSSSADTTETEANLSVSDLVAKLGGSTNSLESSIPIVSSPVKIDYPDPGTEASAALTGNTTQNELKANRIIYIEE